MRFVPSRFCLFLCSVLLPLALLSGVVPEYGWVLPLSFVILIILGLADLYLSTETLSYFSVTFAPVTRLARGNEGQVEVHLCSDEPELRDLTIGLALPCEFLLEEPIQKFKLEGNGATRWALQWKLTARKRGVYAVPTVHIEAASLFRLFQIRLCYQAEGEIRVYPNLKRERKQLANLFLNRGNIGIHTQRMIGQGREYEQLREYFAGDTMTDIHWKASAKRGELVTKTYQVERTQEIYLIIDHSRLSGLRSPREGRSVDDDYAETILERYVTAASVLGMVAEREGDHFGLITFGRQVSKFVRASSGKQHGQVVQDALFDLKTEVVPSDFSELFTFIRTRVRRRALLIFLTDLGDAAAAEAFQTKVSMITGTHVLLVNTIQRDGVGPLYEKGGAAPEIADSLAGHICWDALQKLQKTLRSCGVDFGLLDDEQLSLSIVNQYLNVKRRQIL